MRSEKKADVKLSFIEILIQFHLKVVSSLWLEYPLELLTCRFIMADDGLCFRETFDGEFSDDDEVSSRSANEKFENFLVFNHA
jgi:hypothetical protein